MWVAHGFALIVVGGVLAPGCGFRHQAASCAGADCAPADATGSPDADAEPPVDPFCDPADPTLVACYELEGTTTDASGHLLHAQSTGVTFVDGRVGMATRLDATSRMDVGEAPGFDVLAITIETWIRPTELPTGGVRAGIVDNQGQYGAFLHPDGTLVWAGVQVTGAVTAGTWTHVAFTYDGTARTYVDGSSLAASAGGGPPLGDGGVTGTSFGADNPPGSGSPLLGDLDQLRVFSVARTPAQLCAAAGRSSCP
ncbi:MAG: LamG domain-containing protein [Myxococcota bacterium]|nr:LamG domain-containing protein [Myxococcota bacterium]